MTNEYVYLSEGGEQSTHSQIPAI